MRKIQSLVGGLMLGAVALVATPVYAGYEATDTMLDQADHSTFAGFNWIATGLLADENLGYGVATIAIPYVGTYGFGGCDPIVSATTGLPIGTAYSCEADTLLSDQNATLILQDVFGQVTEGTVNKADNAQGIAQYLDSLFSFLGDGGALTELFIDQTLDQDLADLTMGTSTDPKALGIWQRLHSAFDRAFVATPLFDADSMDQTVEAFMQEEAGGTAPGGYVVSYMGQWFQKGANQKCGDIGATSCTHNEFGGHGTVTATTYTPNVTAHDP